MKLYILSLVEMNSYSSNPLGLATHIRSMLEVQDFDLSKPILNCFEPISGMIYFQPEDDGS